jgi:acetoin utilization protein AcuB
MVVGLSYVAYVVLGQTVQQSLSQVVERMPAADDASDHAKATTQVRPGGDRSATPGAEDAPRSVWLPAAAVVLTLVAAGALVLDRHRRRNVLAELQDSGLPPALQANFVEKRQQILRMLTGHTRRRPGECVIVRHLMTTQLTTVDSSTPTEEICRTMHDTRIRHLLVVQGEDRLLGIISDRDVSNRTGRTAGQLMTKDPVTVTPETPAIQAISMMLGGRFSCVPVVEGRKLVGLLTSTDVMMALQCTLQILSQSLQSLLAESPVEVKGARYFARLLKDAEENPAEAASV